MGITKRRGRKDVEVDLHHRRVKQLDTFKYLGCPGEESVNSEKEIIKRVGVKKAEFAKLRPVLSNLSIGIGTGCGYLDAMYRQR